jgi:hypothetical protein
MRLAVVSCFRSVEWARSVAIVATVASLNLLPRPGHAAEEIVIPRGIENKGVSCDFSALMWFPVAEYPIALHRPSAAIIIFGRYWVTTNVIRMEVIWSEPSWGPQPFPSHPPGMILVAAKDKFAIYSAFGPKRREYLAPFGSRPPASRIDGGWDLAEMRFAWSDYLEEQSQVQDPFALIRHIGEDGVGSAVWNTEQYSITNGSLTSLKSPFFRGRRDIFYEYKSHEGRTWLDQETVRLPERSIAASGLINSAMINGGTRLTNSTVRYHQQGRLSNVEWNRQMLDNNEVLLPAKITVTVPPPSEGPEVGKPQVVFQSQYSADGKLVSERRIDAYNAYNAYSELGAHPIRRMVLTQYKPVGDLPPNVLMGAEPLCNGASPARQRWYGFIQNKYWDSTMAESDTNRILLDQLLEQLSDEYAQVKTPGEELQYLYLRVISALIVSDDKTFAQLVDAYVTLLNKAGAKEIVPNCLLNLQGVCSNWKRENFVNIVQNEIDRLSN